jgi:hypothetical protein
MYPKKVLLGVEVASVEKRLPQGAGDFQVRR